VKATTPDIIAEANRRLRAEFQRYSLAELRWDYRCNIHEETRQMIRDELARRGVSMTAFEALGRGKRAER
jgi:hypothetical protein